MIRLIIIFIHIATLQLFLSFAGAQEITHHEKAVDLSDFPKLQFDEQTTAFAETILKHINASDHEKLFTLFDKNYSSVYSDDEMKEALRHLLNNYHNSFGTFKKLNKIEIYKGMPLLDVAFLTTHLDLWKQALKQGYEVRLFKLVGEKKDAYFFLSLLKHDEIYRIQMFQIGYLNPK